MLPQRPSSAPGAWSAAGHAQQRGPLGVVPATMRHAVYGFGMVCDIQRVQLAHDAQFGARFAGFNVGIKAGNVSRAVQRIAQRREFFRQVFMGLPFGVAGLGVRPKPALCLQNLLPVRVDILNDLLLLFCHGESSTFLQNVSAA